jgi:hypothetical protein
VIRGVPNEFWDGLGINWWWFVLHLLRPFLLQLPSAPNVHKWVFRYLTSCAWGDGGHWILAIDNTEQILSSTSFGQVVDFLEEWRGRDTGGCKTIHITEAVLGELGFVLTTQEFAIS